MDQAIHHLINVRFLAKVPRLFILKDEDLMSLKKFNQASSIHEIMFNNDLAISISIL